jgi:predicted HTH transcriptional regulator
MAVDLFSEDLDKYKNEEKYSALVQFCAARLNEGWRLDYAREWDEHALEKVASFANTFGGVLIIGVKKDKSDPEPLLIGVNSSTEYKTRVASSIAANISPIPLYYVYECHKPGEPNCKLCVVQVRNVNSFHLLTKKTSSRSMFVTKTKLGKQTPPTFAGSWNATD